MSRCTARFCLGVFMGEWVERTGVIRPGQRPGSGDVDVRPGRPVRSRFGGYVGPIVGHVVAAEPMTDDPGAYWVVVSVNRDAVRDGWTVDFT